MPRTFSVSTRITREAKEALALVSDDLGIAQGTVLSSLVSWFASQGRVIQDALLGRHVNPIAMDISKLVLRNVQREPGLTAPVEELAGD